MLIFDLADNSGVGGNNLEAFTTGISKLKERDVDGCGALLLLLLMIRTIFVNTNSFNSFVLALSFATVGLFARESRRNSSNETGAEVR